MPTTLMHVGSHFDVAVGEGMVYLLTGCCKASAKGSMALGVPATVCRACYREIPDWMGWAAILKDHTAMDELALAQILADGGGMNGTLATQVAKAAFAKAEEVPA